MAGKVDLFRINIFNGKLKLEHTNYGRNKIAVSSNVKLFLGTLYVHCFLRDRAECGRRKLLYVPKWRSRRNWWERRCRKSIDTAWRAVPRKDCENEFSINCLMSMWWSLSWILTELTWPYIHTGSKQSTSYIVFLFTDTGSNHWSTDKEVHLWHTRENLRDTESISFHNLKV